MNGIPVRMPLRFSSPIIAATILRILNPDDYELARLHNVCADAQTRLYVDNFRRELAMSLGRELPGTSRTGKTARDKARKKFKTNRGMTVRDVPFSFFV